MNRVARRATALWLFVAILLGGLGFFGYEYAVRSESWVLHSGSPHIYEGGSISCGVVTDRQGNVLLDLQDGRTYAASEAVRMSMLHWLGDRQGNIRPHVIDHYDRQLAGFDPVGGIYDYGGVGGQLQLTLSAAVQQAALEAMGDHKGTVAVYNYRTGQILCAVSTPTFDPEAVPDIAGDTTDRYSGVYLNRFVQSVYIPGSIFKIVTTAAVLENIEDIRQQTFTCTGVYYYGGDTVTCEIPHGTLDLKTAMRRSCNCAYAQIAGQLGAEKLDAYVHGCGVLDRVRFDGITSAAGNFQVLGAAEVELAWSAIGQHKDQINPCAFLQYVGAIANGGQAAIPYVVQSVRVGNRVTYEAAPVFADPAMSESTAAVLQEYLYNNVVNNYGSEHFPGLTVCAKSGTGEVGGGKRANAMFTGFVADAQYPLAFIVAVENAGYGKTVCIPILSKVLEACKNEMDAP